MSEGTSCRPSRRMKVRAAVSPPTPRPRRCDDRRSVQDGFKISALWIPMLFLFAYGMSSGSFGLTSSRRDRGRSGRDRGHPRCRSSEERAVRPRRRTHLRVDAREPAVVKRRALIHARRRNPGHSMKNRRLFILPGCAYQRVPRHHRWMVPIERWLQRFPRILMRQRERLFMTPSELSLRASRSRSRPTSGWNAERTFLR